MNQTPGFNDFVERVKAAAASSGRLENLPRSETPHAVRPIASWCNGTSREFSNLDEVLTHAQSDGVASHKAVCIIENIDWDWIGAIGATWGIEPSFFVEHGANPNGENAWDTLFPENHELGDRQGPSKYKHVDGVFEHYYWADDSAAFAKLNRGLSRSTYRRRCWVPDDSFYPPSSNTRMSYCRVNENLYLFLVDPPLSPAARGDPSHGSKTTPSMQDSRLKTTLKVQCPSRCGMILPQLLKQKVYGLRQALHGIFRHSWHLTILFDRELVQNLAINRGELLHLMSASLHRANFNAIDREIKDISFRDLRDPNMTTNTKLLTLREVLSELAFRTAETTKNTPSHIRQSYETLYDSQPNARDYLDFHSPIERLAAINMQASELERFLMDSFQLLMSSISVVETLESAKQTKISTEQARISMEQASRTTKLTQLAFIYVPLLFVSSLFGMNVKELSEPLPPIGVCLVTLIVVAVATAVIFSGGKLLSSLKARGKQTALVRRDSRHSNMDPSMAATDVEKAAGRI